MNKTIILLLTVLATLPTLAQQYNNLEFVENKGQWNSKVKFQGEVGNGAFFLRNSGYTMLQHNEGDMVKLSESVHGHLPANAAVTATSQVNNRVAPINENVGGGGGGTTGSVNKPITVRSHAYEVDFVGMNTNARIVGEKPLETYNNYLIGDDKSKWATRCNIYQLVTYENVYPNIDVRYFTNDGVLKYEFVVKPGGNTANIVMRFKGADGLKIKNNELIIKTSVGDVTELAPYTYQYVNKEKRIIDCKYQVKGNDVSFKLKEYDGNATLVIDPTLIISALSGSKVDNWGFTATYGSGGTMFTGGIVFGSGYPVTTGAFQQTYGGSDGNSYSMGITKLNASGTTRIWATYVGGSGRDQPHSLIADRQDNLIIAGRTTSPNYPTTVPAFGTRGGWDIVVTKLNASGTALIGSVIVAGSQNDGVNMSEQRDAGPQALTNFYGDDGRTEVLLDGSENVFLASSTQSPNFYTTTNAQKKSLSGLQDAAFIKFDPTVNNVLYSSYFGGSADDAGFVLAVEPSTQNVFMAGATSSNNLPVTGVGILQPAYGGGVSDGYMVVFSNNGETTIRATYIGTQGRDVVYGIQFDKSGFPYVMGISTGSEWGLLNATYGQAGSKQFVGKIKKDITGWVFRTHFGTVNPNPNISPVAFLVDRCENMYISGWGGDLLGKKYPMAGVNGMPVTPNAIKKSASGNLDMYFIVIRKDAASLLYGTLFGQEGGGGEHVDGGTSRYDQNGIIYQAICANCGYENPRARWPITSGACCSGGVSAATTGARCNLGALKIAFNFAGVGAGVKAFIDGVFDTTGCVPLTVTFRDTIRNAVRYVWNFGDGTPDLKIDSFEVKHTYNAVGDYRVRLIAIDSSTCNIYDTAYTTIKVRDNKANLAMSWKKLDPCDSLGYSFFNNSTAAIPFKNNSFLWDFGDGTRVPAGTNSVVHYYKAPGSYRLKLLLVDTSYCNAPGELDTLLNVSPLVQAKIETPSTGCAPYNAIFKYTGLGGAQFYWNFGDGVGTATMMNPTYTFANAGTYVIKLKVVDSATCNKVDSTTTTITVSNRPTSSFTYSPVTPVENTPNFFTNNSSTDAISFLWYFGDGDSLRTTSRQPVEHQYNATDTYTAELIAFNAAGCTDTSTANVQTIVTPRLDLPNAFTPLGPAGGSTVYVRGFAIGKMKFIIYNRWGQKVFETTDRNQGWDGKFRGVVQPMDVYVYTLEVEFTDGTKATKKGDITLLR
jgi:gliding motility-associated-like protein